MKPSGSTGAEYSELISLSKTGCTHWAKSTGHEDLNQKAYVSLLNTVRFNAGMGYRVHQLFFDMFGAF